jgi:hypothetical protein
MQHSLGDDSMRAAMVLGSWMREPRMVTEDVILEVLASKSLCREKARNVGVDMEVDGDDVGNLKLV